MVFFSDNSKMKKQSLIILFLILPIFYIVAFEQTGGASWYGGEFQGKLTANGETFNTYDYTAAHKELPFNTVVTVTNLDNGKTVRVRINDRGPFVVGRIIDLSFAAAQELDMVDSGVARVKVETKDFTELKILYSIQIGAFKNLEYAGTLIKSLEKNGYTAVARLSNSGITRILLENVTEEQLFTTVSRLETLGYKNLLVKQN